MTWVAAAVIGGGASIASGLIGADAAKSAASNALRCILQALQRITANQTTAHVSRGVRSLLALL